MTYTYVCTKCGKIMEINCSIAEKEEKEKQLICPSCGSKDFRRVFNAFIARSRGEGSSGCATCSATSCDTCR
ncbi:MAG: FmdB family zinc ribbon protein [Candidatus Fervidibacter sp.]|uniref:FmdB family zinc ribbon protein n=1 Tax=Candidatus Fervidibacter sp. TaxID=3100871 RepID=UPI00404AB011